MNFPEIVAIALPAEGVFHNLVFVSIKKTYATRHNIGRILLYQYERLARKLNRKPTKQDIDRHYLVNSDIYATLFGSWKLFELWIAGKANA